MKNPNPCASHITLTCRPTFLPNSAPSSILAGARSAAISAQKLVQCLDGKGDQRGRSRYQLITRTPLEIRVARMTDRARHAPRTPVRVYVPRDTRHLMYRASHANESHYALIELCPSSPAQLYRASGLCIELLRRGIRRALRNPTSCVSSRFPCIRFLSFFFSPFRLQPRFGRTQRIYR